MRCMPRCVHYCLWSSYCEVASPHTIRHWHIIAGGRESISTSDIANFNKRKMYNNSDYISYFISTHIVNSTEMNDNITIDYQSRSRGPHMKDIRVVQSIHYSLVSPIISYTAGIVYTKIYDIKEFSKVMHHVFDSNDHFSSL